MQLQQSPGNNKVTHATVTISVVQHACIIVNVYFLNRFVDFMGRLCCKLDILYTATNASMIGKLERM